MRPVDLSHSGFLRFCPPDARKRVTPESLQQQARLVWVLGRAENAESQEYGYPGRHQADPDDALWWRLATKECPYRSNAAGPD